MHPIKDSGVHQLIRIYDLCTNQKYHYKTQFPKQAPAIKALFKLVTDQLPSDYFDDQNFSRRDGSFAREPDAIPSLLEKANRSWSIESISRGRTNFATHPIFLGEVAFKIYESPPGRGQPLANALRVPMAHIIDGVVKQRGMKEDIVVPTHAYVPLAPLDILLKLGEKSLNEALVVAVQKLKLLPKYEGISRIKQLPESEQERKAKNLCLIALETGIIDWTLDNLPLTLDGRMAVVDTEPLYGELQPAPIGDDFASKFPRNAEQLAYDSYESTLSKCARKGLENFRSSSEYFELRIFEETAQRFLDQEGY